MNTASRNTDPHSSHMAESDITTSGERQHQNGIALDVVTLFPGLTSKELSEHCPLDRYQLARRLNDLYINNKVRKVENGTEELKWYIAEKAPVSPVETLKKNTTKAIDSYKEIKRSYTLADKEGKIAILLELQAQYVGNPVQYRKIGEQVERLQCNYP